MSATLSDDKSNKLKEEGFLSKEEQVELAQKAKNGDQEAWGKLYESYQRSILGFFRGRLYDKSLAEDLCQDTFLLAYMNLLEGKYDPTYAFSTYLRQIRSIILIRYYSNGRTIKISEGESENVWKKKKGEGTSVKYGDPHEVKTPGPNTDTEDSESYEDVWDKISRHRSWDKIPPQEKVLIRLEVLRLTTICRAKPNQVISFYFIRLLEWKIEEVIEELSDRKLGDLAERFVNDYADSLKELMNRERICEYFSELCVKLEKITNNVYPEPKFRELRKRFGSTKVKDLVLRIFYYKNPEASLSDWCYEVKEKTIELVNEGIL